MKLNGYFREEFPITQEYIFFNSASKSPMPLSLYNVLTKYYHENLIDHIRPDSIVTENYNQLKQKIAKLIKSKPGNIAIIPNTSVGINIAISCINIHPDGEVLIPATEFPANAYPWIEDSKKRGYTVRFIQGAKTYITEDEMIQAITPKTKVISLSLVDFLTGYKMDVEKIGEICNKNGIKFVVDGMQGCGVVDLDVEKAGIDFFSCAAAKWLLSPCGIGFLYVKSPLIKNIVPAYTGWLSYNWGDDFGSVLDRDKKLLETAQRFEVGTFPQGFLPAFARALDFFLEIGVKNITQYILEYNKALIQILKKYGCWLVSPENEFFRGGIVTVKHKNIKALSDYLTSQKVVTSHREGAIRFSPHIFNNQYDLDRFEAIIKKF